MVAGSPADPWGIRVVGSDPTTPTAFGAAASFVGTAGCAAPDHPVRRSIVPAGSAWLSSGISRPPQCSYVIAGTSRVWRRTEQGGCQPSACSNGPSKLLGSVAREAGWASAAKGNQRVRLAPTVDDPRVRRRLQQGTDPRLGEPLDGRPSSAWVSSAARGVQSWKRHAPWPRSRHRGLRAREKRARRVEVARLLERMLRFVAPTDRRVR